MSKKFNFFIDSLHQKVNSDEASKEAKQIIEGLHKFKSHENDSKSFKKEDNFMVLIDYLDSFVRIPQESHSLQSTSTSLRKFPNASTDKNNMNPDGSNLVNSPPKLINSKPKSDKGEVSSKVIINTKKSQDPFVKFGPNPNQPKDSQLNFLNSDYQMSSEAHSIQLIPQELENALKFTPRNEMESSQFKVENQIIEITYILGRFVIKVDPKSENTFIKSNEFRLIHGHLFQIGEDQIVPFLKMSQKTKKQKLKLRYIRSIGICYQEIISEIIIRINDSGQIMLDESESYKKAFKVYENEGKWMICSLNSYPLLRNLHTSLTKKKFESLPLCLENGDLLKIGEKLFTVKIKGKY